MSIAKLSNYKILANLEIITVKDIERLSKEHNLAFECKAGKVFQVIDDQQKG